MAYSPAFTFASANPLGVLPCAGLRLGALRRFQAFLAASDCVASASSYLFSDIAPLPWRNAFSQFALVAKLWNDPMLLEIPAKTDDEPRYLVIGSIDGKHWSAVITYRGANVRLISVRRARTEEVALYES